MEFESWMPTVTLNALYAEQDWSMALSTRQESCIAKPVEAY
ncbi:MAG: hypothetical protein ACWGOY_02245 [Anaerolineales bacterium]